MTSPVPSSGSGTVSIASADPNAFRTAAFMQVSSFDGSRSLAGFDISTRPGIILGLSDPPHAGACMAISAATSRQSELGDFLRSRRQRLTPKAVGMPEGRRRRTPGLRREEVADLAGIGVD